MINYEIVVEDSIFRVPAVELSGIPDNKTNDYMIQFFQFSEKSQNDEFLKENINEINKSKFDNVI